MNEKQGLIITASDKITSSMSNEKRVDLQDEYLRRAKNRELISEMFRNHKITPHILIDTTFDHLKDTIKDVFKSNDENCISYIYINCHGNENGLYMVLSGEETIRVDFSTLKNILDTINGTFVLMIESCHSGASITPTQSKLRSLKTVNSSTSEDMNKAIISAFAAPKRDPRLRSGEFRADKYQVIAACHADESAWGNSTEGNDFTKLWRDGAKLVYWCLGPNNGYEGWWADRSDKGYVTLQDLCNFTSQQIHEKTDPSTNITTRHYQNDMCYPENSDFPAFGTPPISFISTAIDKYYRGHKGQFNNPIGSIVTLSSGISYQNYSGGVIVRYPNGKVKGFTRLSYVLQRIKQRAPLYEWVGNSTMELYIVVKMIQDNRIIVNNERWPKTRLHGNTDYNIIYEGDAVTPDHPANSNVFYTSDVLQGWSRIRLIVKVMEYDRPNADDHIATYDFNFGIENGWGFEGLSIQSGQRTASIFEATYKDILTNRLVGLDITIKKE